MEAYKTLQVSGQNRVTEVVDNVQRLDDPNEDTLTYKVTVRLDTSYWNQSFAKVEVWRPATLDWSTLFTLTPTKDNWAGKKNDEDAVKILTARATDLLTSY